MAEEQKLQRKKPGRAIKILKWIGLGFLIFWLTVYIVLQAPWKATAVPAVILAACTILPKRYRKWFWLSVGAAVLIFLIWVYLPEDNTGWRPYTFDNEFAILEAKYAVPDEENAALAYDAIFETLDTDSNQPEFFSKSNPSSIIKPWLSENHPETAKWLNGHQDTITKLIQVSQKEKCHFPIPADSWIHGQDMERLAPIRRCAFLLVSAGNNDIGEGRIDAGLEKYLCVLRMAGHMYQQQNAIDFLVASAIESLASNQLNRFVIENEPTAEQLRLIINASGKLENNWGTIFKKTLEMDRLIAKNTFCSMIYEINSEGKVRFSRNPFAMFEAVSQKEVLKPNYWQKKRYKAKAIFAWFGLPTSPQKAGEIFDKSFEVYDAMAEPDFNWANRPQESDSEAIMECLYNFRLNLRFIAQTMAFMLEESYYSLHDAYLRVLSIHRGPRLLIAVRQYKNENGNWPENLDALLPFVDKNILIDPQNNGPFIYKLTDDGFVLYSKGPNNIDENGSDINDADDRAIWPLQIPQTDED